MPVKSAFPKLVAKIDPRVLPKPAAQATPAQPVKPVQPPAAKQTNPPPAPKPPEPMPAAAEIWLEVVNRSDREVFGWAYLNDRSPTRKAIIVVLNRHHWIVEQALTGAESRMLPLLCGQALSEFLLTRQAGRPWIRLTLSKLREKLLSLEQQTIGGSIQFFAEMLAANPSFTRIGPELITTSSADPGKVHKILTVVLAESDQSPAFTAKP